MNPDDFGLIALYRHFSQDVYCAGWLSGVETDMPYGEYDDEETVKEQFTAWLRQGRHLPVESYELQALPHLREAYSKAMTERGD